MERKGDGIEGEEDGKGLACGEGTDLQRTRAPTMPENNQVK